MRQGQGLQGTIDGRKLRVGIVQARFNREITDRLAKGAFSACIHSRVLKSNIVHETVPGSAELPFLLASFANSGRFDALVALSCLMKGETDHYTYIAELVTQGIVEITMRFLIPVGFGVLTVHNQEQALARSKDDESNLGFQAAMAAMENALKRVDKPVKA